MTSLGSVIKGVGPKLVPFFKTLAIYFVVFIPHDQPSVLAMILKCLPVAGLIVFVILQTKSSGSEYEYSKRMITGLFFCLLGDAFLVWPSYFDVGAACFLLGHISYVRAFGLTPLNAPVGGAAAAAALAGVAPLLPNLAGAQTIGVPAYALALAAVLWRAATNLQFAPPAGRTWSRVCTLLGAVSFAVSDLFVGLVQFRGDFQHAQLLIMTTYYGAQLGIALSVLDARIETPKDAILSATKDEKTSDDEKTPSALSEKRCVEAH